MFPMRSSPPAAVLQERGERVRERHCGRRREGEGSACVVGEEDGEVVESGLEGEIINNYTPLSDADISV